MLQQPSEIVLRSLVALKAQHLEAYEELVAWLLDARADCVDLLALLDKKSDMFRAQGAYGVLDTLVEVFRNAQESLRDLTAESTEPKWIV